MNPELFLNPYIAPVYVTATNMITPLATISFNQMAEQFTSFIANVIYVLSIIAETLIFIAKEALSALNENLTFAEKVLLGFCLYNCIVLFLLENKYNEQKQYKEIMETLKTYDKNLTYLKKSERMREDWDQVWSEEIRNMHNENIKKFKEIEKQIRKMKKEIDEIE